MWIGLADGTFEGDCDAIYSEEDQASACMEEGPQISLGLCCLVFVMAVGYGVFYMGYGKEEVPEEAVEEAPEGENGSG